jgi:hypothetical protein
MQLPCLFPMYYLENIECLNTFNNPRTAKLPLSQSMISSTNFVGKDLAFSGEKNLSFFARVHYLGPPFDNPFLNSSIRWYKRPR